MTICKNKSILKLFIVFSLLILAFTGLALSVKAASKTASLYFLPTSGTFGVGQNFSVRVAVNTGGQTINAVEDVISFSKNTLQATSISKESTVIALWVKDPLYNNSLGIISFAGGSPNPGFNGLGRLFRVYFRPIAAGPAWISFSSSAKVLANDGFGTNILSSAGRADFTIKKKTVVAPAPAPAPIKPTILPVSLKIYSLTHPDENKWYNKRDVLLSWDWQPTITDFSYLINKSTKDIPDNRGEGLDISISYTDLTEGIWYFHLKARTRAGWTEAVHYKIQVDITPPSELKINSEEVFPTSNPTPLFKFEAKDELSGIDYIQVQLDENEPIKLETAEYQTPFLSAGGHKLMAKAVDKAGNAKETSLEFNVLPLPVPTVTYWTKGILFGEPFLAKGKAAAKTNIDLTIISEEEVARVLKGISDDKGNWSIKYKEEILKKGQYRFYVTQQTDVGIMSSPSREKGFEVLTNAFRLFGVVFPISALIWLIIFLMAIVIILIVFVFLLYKSLLRRKRKMKSKKAKERLKISHD